MRISSFGTLLLLHTRGVGLDLRYLNRVTISPPISGHHFPPRIESLFPHPNRVKIVATISHPNRIKISPPVSGYNFPTRIGSELPHPLQSMFSANDGCASQKGPTFKKVREKTKRNRNDSNQNRYDSNQNEVI